MNGPNSGDLIALAHAALERGQRPGQVARRFTRPALETGRLGELIETIIPFDGDTGGLAVLREVARINENGRGKLSAGNPSPIAAERKLRFWTPTDLAAEVPTKVGWIVPGYVAREVVTELDGKPKASGKTTLLTHMVRAALDGAPFLGRPTTKTGAVYLTEERKPTFVHALRRAGLLDREGYEVLFWHEAAGIEWPEIVATAVKRCHETKAGLLIVDTLGKFAGLRGDKENNSGDAMLALEPLQHAAATGLGVVVGRHERLSGGEVGESGRGSSQYTGDVDIVLALRRPQGNVDPNLREIHALSRFDETPATLVIALTEEGYLAHGSQADVAHKKAREAILKAGPQSEGDAMKLDDLVKAADVKRTTGQEVVKELWDEGRLDRIGDGKRGDPYRYFLSAAIGKPFRQKETDNLTVTKRDGPRANSELVTPAAETDVKQEALGPSELDRDGRLRAFGQGWAT